MVHLVVFCRGPQQGVCSTRFVSGMPAALECEGQGEGEREYIYIYTWRVDLGGPVIFSVLE